MMNSKIKHKLAKIGGASIFMALILFLSGCVVPEPDTDKCITNCNHLLEAQTAVSESPPPVTDNIVVYLDTSKSMRGYVSPHDGRNFAVSPNGQTVFSKTLLELKNAASLISPDYGVSLRRVSEKLGEAEDALQISTGAVTRDNFYTGNNTDLALAVKSFSQKLKLEDAGPPRFHILVTDGVQSSRNCTQGSDPRCLKEQIFKMIGRKEANWYMSVIGLRSEFDGLVYSEVLPGTSFQYQSGQNPKSFRPFYLYIFSANENDLNQFVDSLKERLLKLKPINPENSDFLREFPVTANYNRYMDGNITVVTKSEEAPHMFDLTFNNSGENPVLTVKVSTETEESGGAKFKISPDFVWNDEVGFVGTKKELSEIIKWEIITCPGANAETRYPFMNIEKVEYADDGKSTINLETGWMKEEGRRGWRSFVLIGRINTGKVSPKWVADWSTTTDTNSREASKTLNLIESLGNLWKNAAIQKQVVAKIYLKVGEL